MTWASEMTRANGMMPVGAFCAGVWLVFALTLVVQPDLTGLLILAFLGTPLYVFAAVTGAWGALSASRLLRRAEAESYSDHRYTRKLIMITWVSLVSPWVLIGIAVLHLVRA